MTKVKVNKQHDYITIRVEWSKTSRVNMTWSRYGEKVSFLDVTDAQARMIMRLMKLPTGVKTNGEWIDRLAEKVAATTNAETLISTMQAARG